MFTDIFLHALTSYFVVIDPIGTALIFHGLTTGCERAYAKRMALRSTLIAAAIVLVSAFFGQALLTKLGISIEALRVSGGLLLFITAFNMVTKGETGKKWESGEEVDISVFPMSIPLLSGPGCLTVTILLFSQTPTVSGSLSLVAAVLVTYLLTYLALSSANRVKDLIGRTGDDILRRLLGVILAALAIQFIADGVRQIMTG
ncbi:MAG: MarC family protein [Desulfuromonadales bacterium]|jgi:multiple antibiotic resistance protein|nr:MarC family protein [Desulfuromonadales bacterium]